MAGQIVNGTSFALNEGVPYFPFAFANTWTAVQTLTGIVSKGGYTCHLVSTSGTSHAYTVLATDEVLALTTGSASDLVVNLPVSTGAGRKILFIKVDSGTNHAVITP